MNYNQTRFTIDGRVVQVRSITLPQIEREDITIDTFNSRTIFPGRIRFSDIELKLPLEYEAFCREWIAVQMDFINSTSYFSAANYKKTMELAVDYQRFLLEGCFIVDLQKNSNSLDVKIRLDNYTQYVDGERQITLPDVHHVTVSQPIDLRKTRTGRLLELDEAVEIFNATQYAMERLLDLN